MNQAGTRGGKAREYVSTRSGHELPLYRIAPGPQARRAPVRFPSLEVAHRTTAPLQQAEPRVP